MKEVHKEDYSGMNGKDYRIRIFEDPSTITVAVNLLTTIDWKEHEDNLKNIDLSTNYTRSEVIEKAREVVDSFI